MAKQKENENVSEFVMRWRELVAQMVERLDEEEQLGMIVKNLKPKIRGQMGYQFFGRFKALQHVANEIEEELTKQAEMKKMSSQYKKTATSVIFVNQVSGYNPFVSNRGNYPNSYAAQGNLANNSLFGYQRNNNQGGVSRGKARDRPFSRLPGPLSKVYEQLREVGMIYLLNP